MVFFAFSLRLASWLAKEDFRKPYRATLAFHT
jgi:hypothetical protein